VVAGRGWRGFKRVVCYTELPSVVKQVWRGMRAGLLAYGGGIASVVSFVRRNAGPKNEWDESGNTNVRSGQML
jgi:hypothetical protein